MPRTWPRRSAIWWKVARCGIKGNFVPKLFATHFDARPSKCIHLIPYSLGIQLDPKQAGACGDVKRLAISITPGDIAYPFGNFDGSEMLPFGRNDPHTSGP